MPGWFRLREDAEELRPQRVIQLPGAASGYAPNIIRNQKYSVWTFLPLTIYEQFKYFFNMYFLVVALSQLIPSLRVGYLFTYIAPLAFVLSVTLLKEAWDDFARYRRDHEANSAQFTILNADGSTSQVASSSLRVGDFVVVVRNQRVPADLVLLRTTDEHGACFVRTDQLDGETDWKVRVAVAATQRLGSDAALYSLRCQVHADRPGRDIHSFVGTFEVHAEGGAPAEPLGVENMLWANTVLASGRAVGAVVYTGKDTRAVMNTSTPKAKMGKLDAEVNTHSKVLCALTAVLAVTLVGLNGFMGDWAVHLCRFVILFSSIIPISLRVNLDMGKTVCASQIAHDPMIPDAVVRNSTIPEELGRVEYVLTDKTGTLTQNQMEFRKIHLGTMGYAREAMDELKASVQRHAARTTDAASASPMKRPGGASIARTSRREVGARVYDAVLSLALCHNVTPTEEVWSPGQAVPLEVTVPEYQAVSPDEVAIVKWAASMGIVLVHRDVATMTLFVASVSALLRFQVLHVFPFSSERKRMGIVVRDMQTQAVVFLLKGADSVMGPLVQYNDWLDEECGNMAREGLRTLVIGRRALSEEDLAAFEARYGAARLDVADRAGSTQRVVGAQLETDLELLAVTGFEDKLQEGVRATLETLRNAGVHVWMLTGDKVETGLNIAVSAKLVQRNQATQVVQKLTTREQALDELETLSAKEDCCLVIDGESLQLCMDECRERFVAAVLPLPAVVCCRCSPTQKADIVRLVQAHTTASVLAIGDGGNDVSMIQAANVGVGIAGKEGMQASLAADYALLQFSHLTRLLLWHGRNSYLRSAKLSQFVIHRGLIISFLQAVFSGIFFYAPIALYQGFLLVGYTTIYTMAPVFSLVLDHDVSDHIAIMYPELYRELQKGRTLSIKTLFLWMLISVYQAGVIMLMSLWLFGDQFQHIVAVSFTALIINELLMVAYEIHTWHSIMVYAEVLTLAVYVVSILMLDTYFDLKFIGTWSFVGKVVLLPLASCAPLFAYRYVAHKLSPPSYAKLR